MTIASLVMTLILVIGVAIKSKGLGLRQYLVIFLITLIQVAIIALYLFMIQPPVLK